MDAARLATVRAHLEEEAPRGHRSIGLANVHKRLTLYCGPAYGLSIVSAPGEGTRVTVRIPWALRARADTASSTLATPVLDPLNEEKNDDVSLVNRR